MTRVTARSEAGRVGMRGAVMVAVALFVLTAAVPSAWAGRRGLSGTMTIDGSAMYATSTTVTVTSSVSGVDQMRFQNAGGMWSSWEAYGAAKSWPLTAGDGQKAVTGQFRAVSGKSLTLTDTIVLDTTAPVTTASSSIVTPPFVEVVFAASDAVSGVDATAYRIDGGNWRTGPLVELCVGRKRASLRPGPHTIEFYSVDLAGNVETLHSLVVTL